MKTIQIKRGTDVKNDALVGKDGELTIDTTAKNLRIHDGITPGGTKLVNTTMLDDKIKKNVIYKDSITANNAVILNVVNDQIYSININGTTVITLEGFISGELSEIFIELKNGGSNAIVWDSSVKWVLPTGDYSEIFADTNIEFSLDGTDFVYLWSTDGGTNIYGKVLR